MPNWIPCGVVTALYGEGGLGKSLLALQLQTGTALGLPWVGLPTAEVRSLGLYCEDDDEELWRRQADINRTYGADFRDLEAAAWMPRVGEDNLLVTFPSKGAPTTTALYRQVIEAALDHRAELVIVDTVADTFGGNENDRSQVRYYVSAVLGGIAKAIGGSVVCCAHPSRSGISTGTGDSGSTGWSAAFRSRLFLHSPDTDDDAKPDPDARTLSRKKANYAARNEAISLHWSAGVLLPEAIRSMGPRRSADEVFLDLLDATVRENSPVSNNSKAGNYAPRMFGRRSAREGYRVKDFETAMANLFGSGLIENIDYGRRSDARRRIMRK